MLVLLLLLLPLGLRVCVCVSFAVWVCVSACLQQLRDAKLLGWMLAQPEPPPRTAFTARWELCMEMSSGSRVLWSLGKLDWAILPDLSCGRSCSVASKLQQSLGEWVGEVTSSGD